MSRWRSDYFALLIISCSIGGLAQEESFGKKSAQYFVSTTAAQLLLPEYNPPLCAPLTQPPPPRTLNQANRDSTAVRHWFVCDMTAEQARAVRAAAGQTIDHEISAIERYPLLPDQFQGPVDVYPRPNAPLGSTSIPGVNSAGDLVALTLSFLQKLWPAAENVTATSLYNPQTMTPVIELKIGNVRRQVIKDENFWETIHVIFVFSGSSERGYFISSFIDGAFAPGLGSNPPAANQFTSFEPDHISELASFQSDVILKIQEYFAHLAKAAPRHEMEFKAH
jgi:hypothetical protein